MKLTKDVWICLALMGLDCLLRLTLLGYWLLAPGSVPHLPGFYKGVQHPEVQAGLLLVALPMLVAVMRRRRRTPAGFERLAVLAMVFACFVFVMAFFLSSNVVGTALVYSWLGIALRNNAKRARQHVPAHSRLGSDTLLALWETTATHKRGGSGPAA